MRVRPLLHACARRSVSPYGYRCSAVSGITTVLPSLNEPRTAITRLEQIVAQAVRRAAASRGWILPPTLVYSVSTSKKQVGADFQTPVAANIAQCCGESPAVVATVLAADILRLGEGILTRATPSAGGAFINLILDDSWVRRELRHAGQLVVSQQLGKIASSRVLVDFASPNMGKELHVGHLRSAVLGDTIARVLEVGGATVDRISHVGDAGVPVAIVLTVYRSLSIPPRWLSAPDARRPSPSELSRAYEWGKRCVAAAARGAPAEAMPQLETVPHGAIMVRPVDSAAVQCSLRELQAALEGGATSAPILTAWDAVCAASRAGYAPLLARLGVNLREIGESAYVPAVRATVEDLLDRGVAVETGGAIGVFVDGPAAPPLLLRKADGGYLYAAIDAAALYQRLAAGFDRIIYITDEAQSHHFRSLFALAVSAGWVDIASTNDVVGIPGLHRRVFANRLCRLQSGGSLHALATVVLEHASFGVVTAGGNKISSRDGTDLTLRSLLDQAEDAVRQLMKEQSSARSADVDASRGEKAAHDEATEGFDQIKAESVRSLAVDTVDTTNVDCDASFHQNTARGQQTHLGVPERVSAIAASAVRYFDLSHNRRRGYRFSYSSAVALRGNTAAYLMYAGARLAALRRQLTAAVERLDLDIGATASAHDAAAGNDSQIPYASDADAAWRKLQKQFRAAMPNRASAVSEVDVPVVQWHSSQRALAVSLLHFPEAVQSCNASLSPHVLAECLFSVASHFHAFYESYRVMPTVPPHTAHVKLSAEEVARVVSALELCAATERVLRMGCYLLGVQALESMP